MQRVVVLSLLCTVLVGCTEPEPPQARSYDSAKALSEDLEDHDAAWGCDSAGIHGPQHPDEIDRAQCFRGDDASPATVHIWDPDEELPEIDKYDNGPHVWWVSGPNWFIATPSHNLAANIHDAVGGTVTSSQL